MNIAGQPTDIQPQSPSPFETRTWTNIVMHTCIEAGTLGASVMILAAEAVLSNEPENLRRLTEDVAYHVGSFTIRTARNLAERIL